MPFVQAQANDGSIKTISNILHMNGQAGRIFSHANIGIKLQYSFVLYQEGNILSVKVFECGISQCTLIGRIPCVRYNWKIGPNQNPNSNRMADAELALAYIERKNRNSIEFHLITICIIAFSFWGQKKTVVGCFFYILRTEKEPMFNWTQNFCRFGTRRNNTEKDCVNAMYLYWYGSKHYGYKTWTLKMLFDLKMNGFLSRIWKKVINRKKGRISCHCLQHQSNCMLFKWMEGRRKWLQCLFE